MFNPHKEHWWNAENKKEAYYMTLRVHYEMPAMEAWERVKQTQAKYPAFLADPIGTLRSAINPLSR